MELDNGKRMWDMRKLLHSDLTRSGHAEEGDEKDESSGQLLTAHTRTCARDMRVEKRRIKTAGAELEFLSILKELQRDE